MTYRITRPAARHLAEIVRRIAAVSPGDARRFRREFLDAFEAASRHPKAFRLIEAGRAPEIRKGRHTRHAHFEFAFVEEDEHIVILAVFHGAMSDERKARRIASGQNEPDPDAP